MKLQNFHQMSTKYLNLQILSRFYINYLSLTLCSLKTVQMIENFILSHENYFIQSADDMAIIARDYLTQAK